MTSLKIHHTLRRLRRHQTGSALILVLLISLVLSAFGIVALRDIAIGTHQSAAFRVRTQAGQLSNAASTAFAMRAGNKAEEYLDLVKKSSYRTESGASMDGMYGVDTNAGGGLLDQRKAYATHGGFIVFTPELFNTASAGDFFPGRDAGGAVQSNETGLFRPNISGIRSFEARDPTEWEVVMRNVSEGFPAPGYSDRFCFRRATIAANAKVGEHLDNWNEPTNVGLGIHANEVFLGPVPCGYN